MLNCANQKRPRANRKQLMKISCIKDSRTFSTFGDTLQWIALPTSVSSFFSEVAKAPPPTSLVEQVPSEKPKAVSKPLIKGGFLRNTGGTTFSSSNCFERDSTFEMFIQKWHQYCSKSTYISKPKYSMIQNMMLRYFSVHILRLNSNQLPFN